MSVKLQSVSRDWIIQFMTASGDPRQHEFPLFWTTYQDKKFDEVRTIEICTLLALLSKIISIDGVYCSLKFMSEIDALVMILPLKLIMIHCNIINDVFCIWNDTAWNAFFVCFKQLFPGQFETNNYNFYFKCLKASHLQHIVLLIKSNS